MFTEQSGIHEDTQFKQKTPYGLPILKLKWQFVFSASWTEPQFFHGKDEKQTLP